MAKLLGIDFGTKRIGLAITDELQIIASPLETVDNANIIDYLKKLLQSENVEAFILGEPKFLDGSISETTQRVYAFKEKLAKAFPKMEIILEDETFTSKMAADSMIRFGAKKKQRRDKSNLDKISAALILQSYLEKRQ